MKKSRLKLLFIVIIVVSFPIISIAGTFSILDIEPGKWELVVKGGAKITPVSFQINNSSSLFEFSQISQKIDFKCSDQTAPSINFDTKLSSFDQQGDIISKNVDLTDNQYGVQIYSNINIYGVRQSPTLISGRWRMGAVLEEGDVTCTGDQSGTWELKCVIPYNFPKTPTITIGNANSITKTTATLNGAVNPNGLATAYYFEYGTGTTTSYDNTTTSQNAGSGTTSTVVTANIADLAPDTTYHFRLVATNSDGTTNSSDGIFTTTEVEVITIQYVPVPDTGITACYNGGYSLNPCPKAGQDFYGQDAKELHKNNLPIWNSSVIPVG